MGRPSNPFCAPLTPPTIAEKGIFRIVETTVTKPFNASFRLVRLGRSNGTLFIWAVFFCFYAFAFFFFYVFHLGNFMVY